MQTRKNGYLLDMASIKLSSSIVYDTDLIRTLEVTDATINALIWPLRATSQNTRELRHQKAKRTQSGHTSNIKK